MPHVAARVTKLRFFGSNGQEYYDNLHNRPPAAFQNRILLFKEALLWSLTKPQVMTLFYLARLVSVTSKQELQIFDNLLRNQNQTLTIRRIPTTHVVLYCVTRSVQKRGLIIHASCHTV